MDKLRATVRGNINLVLALVGVIVLVIVYLTGYQNLSTLNEDMEKNVSERTTYLKELKVYYENLSEYRTSVEEAKVNISKNLSRLPCGIKDEDFLLYLIEANKKVGGKLSSVSFNDAEELTSLKTVINEKTIDVTGFRSAANFNTFLTYEQLKAFLAYIYDESKPLTYLDSVAVTYNKDATGLSSIFNISKYYIEYEGSKYEPVPAPDIPIGKKNLFGAK